MAAKLSPVVPCPQVGPDIIPGLRIALEIVTIRKKTISEKLSMLDMVQELDRIAAMIRLEMEFAAKVGKPLKQSGRRACETCGVVFGVREMREHRCTLALLRPEEIRFSSNPNLKKS